IRFVNKRRDAADAARQNRRCRSKSAHAEHDLRFEFLINRPATGKAFGEATKEAKDGRGINRWKSDRRKFFEAKLRSRRKRETVDLFFGNEQEHFVSAFAQNFGDRDSGKQMTARSSTCNDRVHFPSLSISSAKSAASSHLAV